MMVIIIIITLSDRWLLLPHMSVHIHIGAVIHVWLCAADVGLGWSGQQQQEEQQELHSP
jgi:hypothetical protein